MRRSGWRRWSARTQVERVEVYTIWSLYGLVWGLPVVVLAQVGGVWVSHPGTYAAVGACSLVLVLLALLALRAAVRLYPRTAPLPVTPIAWFAGTAAVASSVVGVVPVPADLRVAFAICVVSLTAWAVGGLVDQRVVGVALVVSGVVVPLALTREPAMAAFCLGMGLFFVFTVRSSLWLMNIVTELDQGRHAQSSLAVAEERLRFSRDVHDVLGRQLSAIAVKAELASSLAARGDDRAAEQMLEVRAVAHEALREARELARGYRAVDLEQELHGARSLLRSAGIECRTDVAALPVGWHEASAWVVREAVTNVLRHSRASRVDVEYTEGRLVVRNDGVRPDAVIGVGTGITGLSERLAPLGASLTTRSDDDGFALVAHLPDSGPGQPAVELVEVEQ